MRAFVAIPLPEEVRAVLAKLQDELKTTGADVAWVEPENIHITLKFLGEITEEQRAAFEAELRRIAAAAPAFTASLDAVGAFPTMTSPRILWVGMKQGSERATALAAQCEEAARKLGLRSEGRAFSAHATLGRVRSPRHRHSLVERLRGAKWTPPPAWPASTVTLYQSQLSPRGATYIPVASLRLAHQSS
jgi:2'-5' RNA ligase